MKINLVSNEKFSVTKPNKGEVFVPDRETDSTLAVVEDIATAFSSADTYEVGEYVSYDGGLYKCVSAVSASGEWDPDYWTAFTVMNEMGGDDHPVLSVNGKTGVVVLSAADVGAAATEHEHTYIVSEGGGTKIYPSNDGVAKVETRSSVTTDWPIIFMPSGSQLSTNHPVLSGDLTLDFSAAGSASWDYHTEARYIQIDNLLYVVGTRQGQENLIDFSSSEYTYTFSKEDAPIETEIARGSMLIRFEKQTDTVKNLATETTLAPAFLTSLTYEVGDYVTHEGLLYKCVTAISTTGAWNANNWTSVAVTDEMGGGVGDRIVSQNERTEVVANQDGTASIIDNEGQKGLNIPEGFNYGGISFEESGLVAFSGPYKLNGAPSNAWFWLPPGVDPSTWEYGTNTPAHIFLGGTSENEPIAVLHNGFLPVYAISGWNTDNPTLTRSQSVPYSPEDITVAMVPLEKTVATVDQMPTDTVSHQELDDALFNKVSQNAQFRMSIKDDGKVVVSGCRYRSANSTTQPFSNTYCVVTSETSLFDGGGGKIDFKIFNSTNGELLYRAVGYATGNWTVLQNNLTSEAASYLPDVGGDIQFTITATTNPENKVLGVYLTSSSVILQPWSNFTSWADSKTKTLATLQNIAADFSMDSTYAVGDYVTYDGSLWKCKVAVTTAGQWTGSDNWEEFIVMDEMGGYGDKANSSSIAPVFSTSDSYSAGDHVTKDGDLYVCLDTTSGSWDSTKWKSISIYANLPYDAELEYIELGNGCWIDPLVNGNLVNGFSHTIKLTDGFVQSAGKYAICGAQQYDIILGIVHLNNDAGLSSLSWGDYTMGGRYKTADGSNFTNTFSSFGVESGYVILNGESLGSIITGTNGDNRPYLIGKAGGTSYAFTASVPKVQFGPSKIFVDGVLVRDFIPVRKNGVGYYYDKISGALFGKASGSADIGLGPDKSGTLPLMDGTAAHGTSTEMSPIDHVHPTDTSLVPWANPPTNNAVTIGKRNGAVGEGSLVVGNTNAGAMASANGSFATGMASALSIDSVALGAGTAHGLYSVVLAGGSVGDSGQNAVGICGGGANYTNAFAHGEYSYAVGRNSIAMGSHARAQPSGQAGNYAGTFVWNQSGTNYYSRGAGTFCINPNGGTAGFYIGNDKLSDLLSSKANSSELYYSLHPVMASFSGTSASADVMDRSINSFEIASGVDNLSITIPTLAYNGKARDFICNINVVGEAGPENVVFGTNQTIDLGSDVLTGMEQGQNVLLFTEISQDHWMISRYGSGGGGGTITIDDHLDPNSTNPVENRAIYDVIGDINDVLDAINGEEI